ncbi:hypothetical protein [Pseudochryseolinea flava]|nr:hypothetical protein [Pseudochryseolinea flava]
MKRLLMIPVTLCLTLFAHALSAQEICNNSIDDDGDGFIDCYDKDCSQNTVCDGFFIGSDACSESPIQFPPLELKLKYKSAPGGANHVSRIVAGDINSDGVNDLVATYTNQDGTLS